MKTMKYITIILLMLVTATITARNYVAGEDVYVNAQQGDVIGDWSKDNANLYIYFYHSQHPGISFWMTLSQIGTSKIYHGTMPAAATYDYAIVVRGTAPDWNHKWNQSGDIDIPADKQWNCINDFDDAEHRWKIYSPVAGALNIFAAQTAEEVMHICPSALGGPLSLRPKLNAAKTQYVYDNVYAHAWYISTNGTTWTAINTYAGTPRDDEHYTDKDLFTTLPASIPAGGIYYYLYSADKTARRKVHVIADAQDCELDCSITSFETAISAVNADDNTYTLDGVVAFGEPNGSLVIECDGQTLDIPSPRSPQCFSLTGVPAATANGVTTTARAYFTGNAACAQEITINVPNATQALDIVTKNILTGDQIILNPVNADPNNDYVWIVDNVEYRKSDGQAQSYSVPAFNNDTTATYVYKEFYPISGTMNDMMTNGGYESADATVYGTMGSTSNISDYLFWDRYDNSTTDINFYDNESINPWIHISPTDSVHKYRTNGFAVVQSAQHFYPTYADVRPREGSYFALFDAATGREGGNKKAWYASTATNPDLKLKAGTTYVLSFWAANINNYGEMDNAAQFKFRIEYNGHTWESGVLDLGSDEYRNNIWHQHSETFYADENCDNVTISVVNLNTNTLNIGNDFALDDIQFHAISSISRVVKSQQKFTVYAHEPKMTAFTVTPQPLACDGGPEYSINMHLEYKNAKGHIIIKDLTTGTEYPVSATSTTNDAMFSKDTTIIIPSLTPEFHQWQAYFSAWPSAMLEAETQAPAVPRVLTPASYLFSEPGCSDISTKLTFNLDYCYQQGTFTYWVDDLPAQTADFTPLSRDTLTLNQLEFDNIPADGKDNHILHISFDGANSCVKTFNLPAVPFSYVIDALEITSDIPDIVLCNTESYDVVLKATTHYDATGQTMVFSYSDNGDQSATALVSGKIATITLTLHNIDDPVEHPVYAAFEAKPLCTRESSAAIIAPRRASCNKWRDTICTDESYNNHGLDLSPMPAGKYVYKIGFNDSLWLTVYDVPRITLSPISRTCDDQTELRFPYEVIDGTPDRFTISIDGQDYSTTIDQQEIVVPLSPDWQAGDYTALISVETDGINCSSTEQVTFTIAASKQLLRKWNDVLFIDNSHGQYTTYQWYENGAEMQGETQQFLYNPQGLFGVYFCRMNTVDNRTVYTCEQPFDAVQRSRDLVPAETPQRVLTLYDVMGHELERQVVTEPLNTPEAIHSLSHRSPGIYILTIREGEDLQVMKVRVP